MTARRAFAAVTLSLVCFLASLASEARAQIVGGAPQAMQNLANGMNGVGGAQTATQLTPDQMQAAMWMRAMQGRGRRGIQTGMPQGMPFGGNGFGTPGFPGLDDPSAYPAEESSSSRRSTPQQRMEMRKSREEQKQVAAKEAKAKKSAAAKEKSKKAAAKKPTGKKPANG